MERVKWIDNYKGFLLLMVILCHIQCHFTLVQWSVTFFMPAFFLISGYLFKVKQNENFEIFLTRKTRSLLLPYLFFSIFAIIFNPFIFSWNEPHIIIKDLYYMINGVGVQGAQPLWFVYTLFQLVILAYGIHYLEKKTGYYVVIVTCIFAFTLGWLLFKNNIEGPFRIARMFTCLFFFIIGGGISKIHLKKINKIYLIVSLFPLFALFLKSISHPDFWCGLNTNNLGHNPFIFLTGTLSGSLVSLVLCFILTPIPIVDFFCYPLRYIARNGIIILPMHWWIFHLLKTINPNMSLLLSTIMVSALLIISIDLFKYLFPFLKL